MNYGPSLRGMLMFLWVCRRIRAFGDLGGFGLYDWSPQPARRLRRLDATDGNLRWPFAD